MKGLVEFEAPVSLVPSTTASLETTLKLSDIPQDRQRAFALVFGLDPLVFGDNESFQQLPQRYEIDRFMRAHPQDRDFWRSISLHMQDANARAEEERREQAQRIVGGVRRFLSKVTDWIPRLASVPQGNEF